MWSAERRQFAGRIAAGVLAAVFCIRVAIGVSTNSATADEPEYIVAGYSYVVTHEHRLDRWHPPLALTAAGIAVWLRFDLSIDTTSSGWLAADARRVARTTIFEAPDPDAILATARVPSLLFGLATVLVIGLWALRMWGGRAGLCALALASFDPNLIAHASVATPDIALTLFMLLAMFAAWRYLQQPTRGRWLAICGFVVLAALTKHLALLLGPMLLVLFGVRLLAADDRPRWLRILGRALLETFAAIAVLLVIALALGGGGALHSLAIGLGQQLWHIGHAPSAYLAGEISRDGFWTYYLFVLLLKIPLGTLALAAIAMAVRRGEPLTRVRLALLVVPIALVVGFVTWTRIDLGVRLILPIMPFLIVLAARAATIETSRWRAVSAGALVSMLVSSTLAAPHELGYVNEVARASGGGARWLSDSNIDWGQDLRRLEAYLRSIDAPPVYLAYFGGDSPVRLGIRHVPLDTAPGRTNLDPHDRRLHTDPVAPCEAPRQLIAISVFRQHGVVEIHPRLYSWLDELDPIAMLGSSIRVYDVTSHPESHVRLAILFGARSPVGRCEQRRAIALDPRMAARFPKLR